LTKSGGGEDIGKIYSKLPVNTTTTFKSLSLAGVVFAGTVSAIAVLGLTTAQPAAAVSFPGPDAFGYRATEIANNLRDISASGTFLPLNDDAVSGAISLGFNFDFYGNTYSQVYVSSNGFLTFNPGSSNGCCNGQSLPNGSSNPSNLVAGFWNDLNNPQGNIRYQTTGSPGSQKFVVGFYNVPIFFDGPQVTFEMILHEGSNNIELQYGAAPNDGSSVTIGITNNGSTDALTLVNADFNLDVGVSNRGFLITPIPEPSSGLGLLALGLLGAGAALKRHWN
jgi:hypothetical protein